MDRVFDEEKSKKFWKGNCIHLLVCVEIWYVIYEAFLCVINKTDFNMINMLSDLLFFRNVSLSHIWYLPMILGMYPLIPFVANALRSLDIRKYKFLILIYAFYVFVIPVVNVLAYSVAGVTVTSKLSTGFSGGAYGLYFLFGYLLKRGTFKNIKTRTLAAAALAAFVLTIALQIFAYRHGYNYKAWYDCGLILLQSVCLFELFSRLKRIMFYPYIRIAAKYSFAVYLIHNMFIVVFGKYAGSFDCKNWIKTIMLFLASLAMGLICAVVIGCIPRFGRYILYIKEKK